MHDVGIQSISIVYVRFGKLSSQQFFFPNVTYNDNRKAPTND